MCKGRATYESLGGPEAWAAIAPDKDMATKHTPGPWVAGTYGQKECELPDVRVSRAGSYTLARVYSPYGKQEKDAALMAASPEMYEALRASAALCEQCAANWMVLPDWMVEAAAAISERVDHALAKAEGR